MKSLMNQTQSKTLVRDLKIAEQFFDRAKGLLGSDSLPPDQALWIYQCNSIHTLFMKYAIDCVFIDKNMKVISLVAQIQPWRVVLPQWGAQSVIEMTAGQIQQLNIKVGDQLYVGN